ncbi:MAG: transketolase [bacterium]
MTTGTSLEVRIKELEAIARTCRVDVIRMLTEAGSGHPGGSLSAIDVIVALFFHKMQHDPARPDDPGRDRFVLSKGHGVSALYAALAHAGYFPTEQLLTYRKLGSPLQGHPDRLRFSLMEGSTGSLGQGLSIAQGLAMASKLDGDLFKVYCMIGDGESQAGQIWEAAMSAPKFDLDTLCVICDYNKVQLDGSVWEIMDLEPLADKWRAFNWHVIEIDGHSFEEIIPALDEAEATKGRPTMIIAHTVKGKGVSFMEGLSAWHGKAPSPEQAEEAIAELLGEAEGGRHDGE